MSLAEYEYVFGEVIIMKQINSLEELRMALSRVMSDTRKGKIAPKVASTCGYIGQILLATLQAEASKTSNGSPSIDKLCVVLADMRKELRKEASEVTKSEELVKNGTH